MSDATLTVSTLATAERLPMIMAALVVLWGANLVTNPQRSTAGIGLSRDYEAIAPSGAALAGAIYLLGIVLADWASSGSALFAWPSGAVFLTGLVLAVVGGIAAAWPQPVLSSDHLAGPLSQIIFRAARWIVGPALILVGFGLALQFQDISLPLLQEAPQ